MLSQLDQGVLTIEKHRTETLSMLLDRVRTEYGIDQSVPLTYAGRLDPMAEGLVLVLVGEVCKQKDTYTNLPKTYEFDIMLGVSTDTHDVLGIIDEVSLDTTFSEEVIVETVQHFVGNTLFPYPMYSSRTVDGIPLFAYARSGTVPREIPMQHGSVSCIKCRNVRTVSFAGCADTIIRDIAQVVGDFRQSESSDAWRALQQSNSAASVQIISCVAQVTSGVYIRTLAHELGKKLGVPALAYRIIRTRIGEYTLQ